MSEMMGKTAKQVITELRELLTYEQARLRDLRGKRDKYAEEAGHTALYLEYSAAVNAASESTSRLSLVLDGVDVKRVIAHFRG